MQKTGAKGFLFLAVVFLIASVLLRFVMLFADLPDGVNIAFYALIVLSIVFSGLSLKGQGELKSIFSIRNNSRISAMAFVASIGFFVNFVHQCVVIFKLIDTEQYRNLIQFMPACFICLLSIISCFYFVCISASFKNDSYDFRKLRLFHIVPLLWSIVYVLTIMSVAIKPLKEVGSMLKYSSLVLLVCFFYFFALEVENDKSSNRLMLIFAKGYSISSFILFVDRVLEIIIEHSPAVTNDNVLSITLLMICFFVFSFEKEIVRKSNLPKGV